MGRVEVDGVGIEYKGHWRGASGVAAVWVPQFRPALAAPDIGRGRARLFVNLKIRRVRCSGVSGQHEWREYAKDQGGVARFLRIFLPNHTMGS
jgi:hypothetical protein